MTVYRGSFFAAAIGSLFVFSWSGSAGALTFEEACALESTVNCWGFEDENVLHYGWDESSSCGNDPFLTSHPNGHNGITSSRQGLGNTTSKPTRSGGCTYPKRDSTHSASGAWSLKFTYRRDTGDNPSGNFNPVFKRLGSSKGNYRFAQFGKGGEFWVRFSMRQSQGLIELQPRTVTDKSVSIKRMWVAGNGKSNPLTELMGSTTGPVKIYDMSSNQGRETYGKQDNIGCTRDMQSSNFPQPPCVRMIADQWRSYEWHIVVADNAEENNGFVEFYVEGYAQPLIRISNADMETKAANPIHPLTYTEDAVLDGDGQTNGYMQLFFSLFTTNKNDSHAMPSIEPAMWIDNIIVSKTRVPALDGSGPIDTTPPKAPSDVTSQ